MDFKQKRKYSMFFVFGTLLLLASLGVTFIAIRNTTELNEVFENDIYIYLMIWGNFLLWLLVYNQSAKKSYYLSREEIIIKKPLYFSQRIFLYQINDVRYNPNDHIFFFWGKLPSIKVIYDNGKKIKNVYIRVKKPQLLYTYLQHEARISRLQNPSKAF